MPSESGTDKVSFPVQARPLLLPYFLLRTDKAQLGGKAVSSADRSMPPADLTGTAMFQFATISPNAVSSTVLVEEVGKGSFSGG